MWRWLACSRTTQCWAACHQPVTHTLHPAGGPLCHCLQQGTLWGPASQPASQRPCLLTLMELRLGLGLHSTRAWLGRA